MKAFRFLSKNWYYVGGVLFVALAFLVGFFGDALDPLRNILLLSFMALLVHQFEEYAIPGGFPAVFNIGLMGEKELPDRRPLNRKSALIVNVIEGYPFYLLAVIFPGVIWLGLVQILFGMAQFLIHGIVINLRLKTLYNPGLGTVVFLHWPIGLYYIWYVYTHGLIQPWHWIAAVVCTILVALLIIMLPIRLFTNDMNPAYAFSAEEMERFHVKEKMANLAAQ